ncbi:MAG TPA: hypothetical protein VGC41_20465 [Kofleriaceae bacterium]
MATGLLLDERILSDGRHAKTIATIEEGKLHLADDEGATGALPMTAVDRVMQKYGLPLEANIPLVGEALECGDGRRLRRLRFHAVVDAEGRDYLVWERPGEEPLAVIATHATAALRYLATSLKPAPSEN